MQQLISLGLECLQSIQTMTTRLSPGISDLMQDPRGCAAASGCLFGMLFLCLVRLCH